MAFAVVMYGCESWTIKKAEHQRIDAFELWCWRRLLRVSWTARRSNQSILKESESEVAQSCPTLCDPMDSSLHQAPLSMGFSRQEYWSGLPFPSLGNLPTQESNPGLSHCRQMLYHLSHQGSPKHGEIQ